VFLWFCVFLFKQRTSDVVLRSLVGAEMCIRDCPSPVRVLSRDNRRHAGTQANRGTLGANSTSVVVRREL